MATKKVIQHYTQTYTEEYREAAFHAWYRSGAKSLRGSDGRITVEGYRLLDALPPDENGNKPSINTFIDWIYKLGWRERADALDAQVSLKLDKDTVSNRVKVLREIADAGDQVMKAGLKFIKDNPNPFEENPAAAVRAVISGAEMKFKYAGMADILAKVGSMSDKQVEQEILQLLGKEQENKDDDVIESSLEDMPSDDADESDNT